MTRPRLNTIRLFRVSAVLIRESVDLKTLLKYLGILRSTRRTLYETQCLIRCRLEV